MKNIDINKVAWAAGTHPQNIRLALKYIADAIEADPELRFNNHSIGTLHSRTEKQRLFLRDDGLWFLPSRRVVALRVKSREAERIATFEQKDFFQLRLVGTQGGSTPESEIIVRLNPFGVSGMMSPLPGGHGRQRVTLLQSTFNSQPSITMGFFRAITPPNTSPPDNTRVIIDTELIRDAGEILPLNTTGNVVDGLVPPRVGLELHRVPFSWGEVATDNSDSPAVTKMWFDLLRSFLPLVLTGPAEGGGVFTVGLKEPDLGEPAA